MEDEEEVIEEDDTFKLEEINVAADAVDDSGTRVITIRAPGLLASPPSDRQSSGPIARRRPGPVASTPSRRPVPRARQAQKQYAQRYRREWEQLEFCRGWLSVSD